MIHAAGEKLSKNTDNAKIDTVKNIIKKTIIKLNIILNNNNNYYYYYAYIKLTYLIY